MTTQYAEIKNLRLAYETFGQSEHPPLILVMGLGSQLVHWPVDFCQSLADKGYFVVRFDNRDIGLSSKIHVARSPSVPATLMMKAVGLRPRVPYTLHDMAEDSTQLLDTLGIDAAHWVGVSMGGMIAQLVAAKSPARCLSLTSIMSTTGNPRLPQASVKVRRQLLKRAPGDSMEQFIEHMMITRRMIESPGFKMTDDELKARIEMAYKRSFYPQGVTNQMAAIIATGDRRSLLKQVVAPTLVVHGHDDPLVPVEGGIDTAKHIQGSQLRLIEGMGHDLPPGVCELLAEHIGAHLSRVTEQTKAA